MKKKKKKYLYKGIRNYPIKIENRIVRPGDIIEVTEADIKNLNWWHFESMDTTTTEIFEMPEMDEKTKKKTKRGEDK